MAAWPQTIVVGKLTFRNAYQSSVEILTSCPTQSRTILFVLSLPNATLELPDVGSFGLAIEVRRSCPLASDERMSDSGWVGSKFGRSCSPFSRVAMATEKRAKVVKLTSVPRTKYAAVLPVAFQPNTPYSVVPVTARMQDSGAGDGPEILVE